MLDASVASLINRRKPGKLGSLLGRLQKIGYLAIGRHRYDNFRLEQVGNFQILVLPSVANPKLLRTGAWFESIIASSSAATGQNVLDLGTGSGICALSAARTAKSVVAVDVNPAAVRCARVNALINGLEERLDVRQGDLFAPVADEHFDLVLFNPPFIIGQPKDAREAAWRSSDIAGQFASQLREHMSPGGMALLLLSSFGDAAPVFESELKRRGFEIKLFAKQRFVNELLTVVSVKHAGRKGSS